MSNVHIKEQATNDIKSILAKAGVRNAGRHPFTTYYLPRVLHEDERIVAAVFGRRKESEGFFGFVEGLLVATDKRVLFIDNRPGYTTMDEISYDVVSGVNVASTVFYASVTLFTKIANYTLSFANHAAVDRFADYVEKRVIDREEHDMSDARPSYEVSVADNAMNFLRANEIGVLSSIERTGAVAGAAVYYVILDGVPYFMTRVTTRKASNILGNQHVAFTVFDAATLQTAQIQGIVEQVQDEDKKTTVLTEINRPRTYEDGSHKTPIMRMGDGEFVVYRIIPTQFHFIDYRQK